MPKIVEAHLFQSCLLDDSGDGLRLLQEHLGHVSFSTTAKYRKVAGEELWSNPLFTLYPEIGPSHMKRPDQHKLQRSGAGKILYPFLLLRMSQFTTLLHQDCSKNAPIKLLIKKSPIQHYTKIGMAAFLSWYQSLVVVNIKSNKHLFCCDNQYILQQCSITCFMANYVGNSTVMLVPLSD